jgi:hypothetical protein
VNTISLLIIVPLLLGIASCGLLLPPVAGLEHARRGRGLWLRALLVSLVGGTLTAVLGAAAGAGLAFGIPDENAGEALVMLVGMALGTGFAGGFVISMAATLALSWLLARRRVRSTGVQPCETGLLHSLSATAVGGALGMSLAACLVVTAALLMNGLMWGVLALLGALPGLVLALMAILGRRWFGGSLALLVSIGPALVAGGYAAWDLPETRTPQVHQAVVVEVGVLEDQALLQRIPRDRDAFHRGLRLSYLSCEQDIGVRLTPKRSPQGHDVPEPALAACLEAYGPDEILELEIELRHKRFSGALVRYDVVRVGACQIPEAQAGTVPALTHCAVEY